ncbi:MAG: sigma 54-interacting transcriptional regulator [candidate division NC10 bacterium]|nr:sigma 54-interacting transcriptional regulator [candidate division NC10 bacterium]
MAIPRELIERIVPSLTERLGMPLVLGGELVSLRTKLPRVARSDAPVLLRGPCGAEKERVARAVHYLSCRAAFPFITITCGKLTEEGLRRALFGWTRGGWCARQRAGPSSWTRSSTWAPQCKGGSSDGFEAERPESLASSAGRTRISGSWWNRGTSARSSTTGSTSSLSPCCLQWQRSGGHRYHLRT